MLIACTRSMVDPSGSERTPVGAPSMNADCVDPSSSLFQSGTVRLSSIERSTAASAAYNASELLEKLLEIIVSDDVVSTRAMPSADINSIAIMATTIAIPCSSRICMALPTEIQIARGHFEPDLLIRDPPVAAARGSAAGEQRAGGAAQRVRCRLHPHRHGNLADPKQVGIPGVFGIHGRTPGAVRQLRRRQLDQTASRRSKRREPRL